MKKKTFSLIALSLAAVAMAACSPTNAGSSSIVDNPVYMIQPSDNDIPILKMNETIDLAEYFTVIYSDDTKSNEFVIKVAETAADSLLVDGTKITPKKIGTYDIEIQAGAKSRLITIECRTEFNIDTINFFNKLNSNPKNFTMDIMDINNRTGEFTYDGLTALHNENYFVWYNRDNPGELTKNGEANSTILALLNDNKGYWGNFDENGNIVFTPGAVGFDNYIISAGMEIDGTLFTSKFDQLGDEMLEAPASVSHNLLYYGMPVESSEYVTGETRVVAINKDAAGEFESIDLVTYVYASEESTKRSIYAPIRIHSLGTSKIDALDVACADAAYIPTPLTANEIGTAFAKVKEAGNYTVTTSLQACDADGKIVSNPGETYAYEEVFGSDPLTEITTVTSDGVESVLKRGEKTTKHAAYFNRDNKAYSVTSEYNNDTGVLTDTVALMENVTDAKSTTEAKAFTADGVTGEAANASVWTKKKTDDNGNYLFSGRVGDNDGATEVTNEFYAQIMNQMAFISFKEKDGDVSTPYGSYLCAATDGWVDGSKRALTTNSSYDVVKVNPTTGEITITAIIQYPASSRENRYWYSTYTITNIGTTTADFSGYTLN